MLFDGVVGEERMVRLGFCFGAETHRERDEVGEVDGEKSSRGSNERNSEDVLIVPVRY